MAIETERGCGYRKVGGKLWRVPAIALEEFLGDKGKKK